MIKKLIYIALIFTFIFALSGCGVYENKQTPSPHVATPSPTSAPTDPPPKSGGTLKLSMRTPQTLNPILNEDVTVDQMLKLIFEPLVVLDETIKPSPNLAQSFQLSPDGLTCTIVLRNDISWEDGTPLTSQDLIYTLDTISKYSKYSIYKGVLYNISSYKIVDDYTVNITYKQPDGGYAYNLCFPLIPKHYYNNADDVNMMPLGNGLYKFDNYEVVKEVNLSTNNKSFREKPYISRINIVITSDQQTDLYAFSNNIIDVLNAKISRWGKYKGTKEANISEYTSSIYNFIGFNFNDSSLQDKNVRKALAHSINIDEIMSNIYLKHGERAYTPICPTSWVFEPNTEKYDYNFDLSTQLLKEAGYGDSDHNNILDKNVAGVVLELDYKIVVNVENEERKKIANILSQSLKKLNIKSTVVALPFEEYENALKQGDFDLFVGGFNMSYAQDLTFAFYSSDAASDKSQNYFNYNNQALDNALNQVLLSTTNEAYKRNISDVQKLIAEDLPCISIAYEKSAVLTDTKVKGIKKPVINNIFNNINQWFIYE